MSLGPARNCTKILLGSCRLNASLASGASGSCLKSPSWNTPAFAPSMCKKPNARIGYIRTAHFIDPSCFRFSSSPRACARQSFSQHPRQRSLHPRPCGVRWTARLHFDMKGTDLEGRERPRSRLIAAGMEPARGERLKSSIFGTSATPLSRSKREVFRLACRTRQPCRFRVPWQTLHCLTFHIAAYASLVVACAARPNHHELKT
jgi:hypothetical protein